MFVYLDNSATTKPYAEVIGTMLNTAEANFGNPSSLHRMGVTAEKIVKGVRRTIAQTLGALDEEITFTSGGTESDNLVLFGAAEARKRRGNRIVTTKIEHPAVLESCKRLEALGFSVEYIGVDNEGKVDLSALEAAAVKDTILISVMAVNNEVGTIQPLKDIGAIKLKLAAEGGNEPLLHTDAVQSYGKCSINLKDCSIDFASLSGHKIHGPKGIGALYVKKGINILPHTYGGGQEKNLRSGTENVPAIAGFGAAAEINHKNLKERLDRMAMAKAHLLAGIKSEIKDIRVNSPVDSSPSILNISFLGVKGEVLLHTLEQQDIYVSTGSACSSNKKGMSHVLKAMGLSDGEIEGAIRFSFCEFNTIEEMDYVLTNLKTAVNKFRKLGRFR